MKKNNKSHLFAASTILFWFSCATNGVSAVITSDLGTIAVPSTQTVSGTLATNSTALEELFTVTSNASVSAFTTSYASGGFQPNLQLFTSTGTLLANQNASNGDSSVSAVLTPGTYIALLSEFDYQLDPSVTTFTPASPFIGPFTPSFSDEMGAARTGAYSLTISTTGAVPEPATIWLIAPSLLGAFYIIRKRRIGHSLL